MEGDNIKSMDLPALRRLRSKIEAEVVKREKAVKRDLLAKIQRLAVESGIDPSEVLGGMKGAAARVAAQSKGPKRKAKGAPSKAAPPIYFNPVNPSEGWSGRGRQPSWFKTFVENGGDIENLKKRD